MADDRFEDWCGEAKQVLVLCKVTRSVLSRTRFIVEDSPNAFVTRMSSSMPRTATIRVALGVRTFHA